MDDKKRIQVNVHLGQGQMEQLRILADHYGSISGAVRVALDALWREYVRSQAAVIGGAKPGNEDEQPGGAAPVAGTITDANG